MKSRPRSLVFVDTQTGENFYPEGKTFIKKRRSATILREKSVSPRKVGPSDSAMMLSSTRMCSSVKPSLTSTKISPSKVRGKIRQANSVRSSKSLPRNVGKESKKKHQDEFQLNEKTLSQFSWSESD